MNEEEGLAALTRQTRRLLQSLEAAGIHSVPAPAKSPAALQTVGQKEALLAPVRERALVCRKCKLCKGRTQVVFGEGSLDARLVFVGEGPGRDEDLQGRPFVGAAGQLLTRMIEAMKMRREEVYIANVVKCRPPNNRPPEPDEVEHCREYLEAQLTVIAPRVLCALGKTAASALLQSDAPMSALRGRVFDWNGSSLVVTYHPAYLLRNPPAKRMVWEDMQRVMGLLKGSEE